MITGWKQDLVFPVVWDIFVILLYSSRPEAAWLEP